ncbi:unnamed protein product [Linum trigynum]|uniref:Uncharacterized protein n=1 Tax=Linum trigynum TaxID=586398 RepID=A0AAV2ESQ2_9ROSI
MVDTRSKKKMKEVVQSRVANRIVLRSRHTAFEGVVEYDGSDDNYDDFTDVNEDFFEGNHSNAGGSSGPRLEPEVPFVSSSFSQIVHVRRGPRVVLSHHDPIRRRAALKLATRGLVWWDPFAKKWEG